MVAEVSMQTKSLCLVGGSEWVLVAQLMCGGVDLNLALLILR